MRLSSEQPVFAGTVQKNAPVPIQGQMRENTSAVPPCLTEKSAHLTQVPTHPKPANAGSASRNTHRSPCFPRALGGPFAGSLRSGFQPWPESLCVRRRFDLRLNGLAQCSTADALCQDWSCIFHVLHVTQRSACPLPFLLPLRPQTQKEGDCLKSTMCRHLKSGVPFLCPPFSINHCVFCRGQFHTQKEKPLPLQGFLTCRSGEIRTRGLLDPNQTRYQAALHLGACRHSEHTS